MASHMVVLYIIFKLSVISITCIFCVTGNVGKSDQDQLVSSPIKFIGMALKEKIKNYPVHDYWRPKRINLNNSQQTSTELSELSDDETRLKLRKVWSRWGKWSECSATCGGGTMRRLRTCVAGRCASGELEEQSRPCATAPCARRNHNTEYVHELELE